MTSAETSASIADNRNRFAVYDPMEKIFTVDMGYGEIRVCHNDAMHITGTTEVLAIQKELMSRYKKY